jgi:hypothetical protein
MASYPRGVLGSDTKGLNFGAQKGTAGYSPPTLPCCFCGRTDWSSADPTSFTVGNPHGRHKDLVVSGRGLSE